MIFLWMSSVQSWRDLGLESSIIKIRRKTFFFALVKDRYLMIGQGLALFFTVGKCLCNHLNLVLIILAHTRIMGHRITTWTKCSGGLTAWILGYLLIGYSLENEFSFPLISSPNLAFRIFSLPLSYTTLLSFFGFIIDEKNANVPCLRITWVSH